MDLINWSAKSGNLTPADFSIWKYCEGDIIVKKPNTIQELKYNIDAEINAISITIGECHQKFQPSR
nr:unnamed protein product [Callosobruchus chinensis]